MAGAGAGEIEAPYIFRKTGYFYLFASWGLCCKGKDRTYRVMVGRASDVSGPYLDRAGKDMATGGHNSVYTMAGKDLLALHAYERADKYLQKLKIMQIQWDKDSWPTVDPRDLNRYNSTQLP